MSDDLESANEKLEIASNEFQAVTLTRYEAEALIEEFNGDQAELKAAHKKELRMEWPILFLIVLLYYLAFKYLAHQSEIHLLEWARREYSELLDTVL